MVTASRSKPDLAIEEAHGRRLITQRSWQSKALARPEIGAVGGSILIFGFFAIAAGQRGFLTLPGTINYVQVAAELGIMVVPMTLLLIAGEFDLSVGSMIGFAAVFAAICTSVFGLPLALSILLTLVACGVFGFAQGLFVTRTGLSSIIVTLASLFILRGVAIAGTAAIASTNSISLAGANKQPILQMIFASTPFTLPISILWWVILVAVGQYVLQRTAFGNWIFATGAQTLVARTLGVPTSRVKVILFSFTALAAALVGMFQLVKYGAADTSLGQATEFEVIVATIIGGTLITGGFGSVIGGAFGALIFGMVNQGIYFTEVNGRWFLTVLGVMLLVAVLINRNIHRLVMRGG